MNYFCVVHVVSPFPLPLPFLGSQRHSHIQFSDAIWVTASDDDDGGSFGTVPFVRNVGFLVMAARLDNAHVTGVSEIVNRAVLDVAQCVVDSALCVDLAATHIDHFSVHLSHQYDSNVQKQDQFDCLRRHGFLSDT